MDSTKPYKGWTQEEVDYIITQTEQGVTLDVLAKKLNRSVSSVRTKLWDIKKFGLRRKPRGDKKKNKPKKHNKNIDCSKIVNKPITPPDPRLKLEVGKEYRVYNKPGIGRRLSLINTGQVIEDLDRFYLLDNGSYLFTIHKADFTDYTLKEVI